MTIHRGVIEAIGNTPLIRLTRVNVAGAVRLARQLGPGHTIVTVLCDYGTRYQSKQFDADFLRSKGLPVPAWIERADPLVHQVIERSWR